MVTGEVTQLAFLRRSQARSFLGVSDRQFRLLIKAGRVRRVQFTRHGNFYYPMDSLRMLRSELLDGCVDEAGGGDE